MKISRTSPLSVREGELPWSIWLFLFIMAGYAVLGFNLSENERGRLQVLDDVIRHVSGGVLTGIVATIFIEEVVFLMLVAFRRAKEWSEKRKDKEQERIRKETQAVVYQGLLQFLAPYMQHQDKLSDWYRRFNEAKEKGTDFDEPPPDFEKSSDLRDLFSAAVNNETYNGRSSTDE
jgi:hypothetical protein